MKIELDFPSCTHSLQFQLIHEFSAATDLWAGALPPSITPLGYHAGVTVVIAKPALRISRLLLPTSTSVEDEGPMTGSVRSGPDEFALLHSLNLLQVLHPTF
ncbi:hypothetical protein GJ744_002460 [Endocarpon pusillum]|uniref:Uncharacterized protein n=1 Tax=Endocarpon pusillum TaxID=364733 RepID=A0A8H7E0H2_9EURO|nr:hypothetical protein GJ744_002460 [Endocarpon pusillum]